MAAYNFTKTNVPKNNNGGSNVTTTFNGLQTNVDFATNAAHANSADKATSADTATLALSAETAYQADQLTNTVDLLGNDFNGTQDITDITANTVNVSNNLTVEKNANISGNTYIKGNVRISGTSTFNGASNFYGQANFNNNAHFSRNVRIEGDLETESIYNNGIIATKDLKVNGGAHFFELILDKINVQKGSSIYSVADGFVCDYIEIEGNSMYLYFRDNDGTRQIDNNWQTNDMVVSRSTSNLNSGQSFDVDNKYFWGVVNNVSLEPTKQNTNNEFIDSLTETYDGINHKTYHYIVVDITEGTYDGSYENLSINDTFSQLGNTTDETRASAIYIATNASLDLTLQAPLIAFYQRIGMNPTHRFDLSFYRKSYFDRTSAKFVGDFSVEGYTSIEDYIEEVVNDKIGEHGEIQIYTYYKYNTQPSDEGAIDTDNENMTYIGVAVTTSTVKPTSGYTWQLKQKQTEFYTLVDGGSSYIASGTSSANTRCAVSLRGMVVHYTPSGAEMVKTLPSNIKVYTTNEYKMQDVQVNPNNGVFIYETTFVYSESAPKYYGLIMIERVGTSAVINGSFKIPLGLVPQAIFNIQQGLDAKITAQVSSLNGTISQLQIYADGIKTDVGNLSGEISELSQTVSGITSNVSNLSGQTTQLQQTVDGISTNVSNLSGQTSQLQQTVDNISLTVTQQGNSISNINQKADSISLSVTDIKDGLSNTGIDISSHKIRMYADNFTLLNNQNQANLEADENGNLSVRGDLTAQTLALKRSTSENVNGYLFGGGILPKVPQDATLHYMYFVPQTTRATYQGIVTSNDANAKFYGNLNTFSSAATSVTLSYGIYDFYGYNDGNNVYWFYQQKFSDYPRGVYSTRLINNEQNLLSGDEYLIVKNIPSDTRFNIPQSECAYGRVFSIKNTSSNKITLYCNVSEYKFNPINTSSLVSSVTLTQGQAAKFVFYDGVWYSVY